MNHPDFDAFAGSFMDDMETILHVKGNDYTKGTDAAEDRLSNFKQVASMAGVDPKIIWLTYFMKHVTAVASHCKGVSAKSEPIQGRFLDLANYALLGAAICQEESDGKPPVAG